MGTTAINQTTTYVADKTDENYVVNVALNTPGLAIDATGAITGRTFTINGTLTSESGSGILLGDKDLADIGGFVKIGDIGTFETGGKGLVARSGGVNFENDGIFATESTAVELLGDNNVFKNVSSNTGPGQLSSNNGSVLVTAGGNDNIENTGAAEIIAQLDAIVSTGNHTSIANNGTAKITSIAGSAIVASGKWDTIYSVSQIDASKDVIVSTGDNATITNTGGSLLASINGRGIVSRGDNATMTNQAAISAHLDGIVSTGDHATITNQGTIDADRIGVSISGDHSALTNTKTIAAATALTISGDDVTVSNDSQLSGTSKKSATIEVTASGHTVIVNHGAISTQSGTVLSAGEGNETVVNTSSLYGVVNLGGGDDVFKSLKGDVSGAVNGGGGNDRILNTGLLEYDVDLGSGDDVFTSLKGEVRGSVLGGRGDDLYVVGISLDIRETAHGGTDTVQSKFTYTLARNVENLQLIGKGRMEATGNVLGNRIEGNEGDNHLTGLGGKDVFVFETGCRQDIVDDFADARDRLDLSGYKGIDGYSDLHGKIVQSGADVVISLNGGDQVTIEHAHKDEFSGADFIF